jgi:hypothetical protein
MKAKTFLYKPRPTYRKPGGAYVVPGMQAGENLPFGVMFRYYLDQRPDTEVVLRFFDSKGDTVISYSSVKDKKGEPVKVQKEFYQDTMTNRPGLLPVQKGMNQFVWDMRYPDAKNIESGNNAIVSGMLTGPLAVPGNYTARLYIADKELSSQQFEILKDPRVSATQEDLQKQFDLQEKIIARLSDLSTAVNDIRKITKEVNTVVGAIKDSTVANRVKSATQPLLDSLKKVEEEITQPKAVTDYDLFNFPNRLNDKIAGLNYAISAADFAPTASAIENFNELSGKCDVQLARLKTIIKKQLPEYYSVVEKEKLYMIKD